LPHAAWLSYFGTEQLEDRNWQRAMTRDEVFELRDALSAVSYVPRRALWLSVGIGTALLAARSLGEENPFAQVHLLLLVVGAIAVGLCVAQRVQALRLLHHDLATCSLEIVAFGAQRRQSGLPAVLEYLPRSGRAWSIDQRPAPWRARADLGRHF
jgi:hypothetical protein